MMKNKGLSLALFLIILISSCAPAANSAGNSNQETQEQATATPEPVIAPEPFPTRPVYAPGELVDYIAQPGDTLTSIASHFNTKVSEILTANSFIPANATTMPPSMPMKIPIYYAP